MLECEGVELGLEDGELGFDRAEVGGAERGAMSGVGGRDGGAILESRKADATAGRHDMLRIAMG